MALLERGDRIVIRYYDYLQNLTVIKVNDKNREQPEEYRVKLQGISGEFFDTSSMNILTNVIKKKEIFNIALIDKNELVLTYSTSKQCLNTQIWNAENLKPKNVGNKYEKTYAKKNAYKPGLKPNNYATYNAKRYTAQDRLMKYRKTEELQIVHQTNKFKQPENRQLYNTDNTRYSAQDRLKKYKNIVTSKEPQLKQYDIKTTDMNRFEIEEKCCKEQNLSTDITEDPCTKKRTLKLGETQKVSYLYLSYKQSIITIIFPQIMIVQKRTKTCYLVHTMESRKSVITLCDKLRKIENNLKRIEKVEKYDMCLIFFGAEWYRGKIMDETNDGMLKIYLIDTAQVMFFNRKEVYEMPKHFEGESLLIEIVVTPPPNEMLTTVFANVEAIKTIGPSTVVKLI
ncbi:uncharacterized protein LOC126903778 isoform X1 [Daktulosphaira vitifoliae]|uniref:uncharacterized protein LOC126903778 isoform X1 n=1 Tax=Daktulosphaira vitifoliae TaxID=58002 RepID=UPI0021AA6B86|nr:uncharacterized protein LOC126903778 isoform X1 [Daktulosphaira vitifoliae]